VTFTIALSNPAGGAVLGAQTTATVTIDNDQRPIPQTYLVTNEDDNGPGSLRQAILDANAHRGTDTIAFALGSGTILVPRSPLPPITDPVIIDGTTALGYAGTPLIEICGLMAGPNATGLDIETSHSTVKGLVIDDFQTGLEVNGQDNTVVGDWIGLNAYGPIKLPNLGTGIWIPAGSSGNTIGGATAADANIISDNQGVGLEIDGSGNQVESNWIGLDPTGLAALPNGTGAVVTGAGNTIGGANVISGNTQDGIDITGTAATANVVQGNQIGPNATGGGPVPNGGNGVLVENQAAGNLVGGSTAGAGNILTANPISGVHLASGSTATQVLGNTITTFSNENRRAGGPGVLIEDSSNNIIGTTSPGAGNTITARESCVAIVSGTGNAVRGNAIFQLSYYPINGVGIDLGWDGFTPNHSGFESGPNNYQNFPVISSVKLGGVGAIISGSLNSTPNTVFLVDLYTSQNYTQSGEAYMATVTVKTNAAGQAYFSKSVPLSALTGYYVTATATDPGNNTSELCSTFQPDTDGDGIPDWEEAEADNNGDANGDGIPDRFQPNVASIGDLGTTFVAPAGTQFSQVGIAANAFPPNPPGLAEVPFGLFTWTLSGLAPGAATTVQVIFPNWFPFNTYYRYGPTPDNSMPHWDTFTFNGTTGGQVTGPQTITLHLVDGGRGDDDLTPNGVIKEVGAPVVGPMTYLVTNTNDSGPGSLRQAILDSNSHPAQDTIAFAIGSGPQTIALQDFLPPITDPVIIDATTQPGYAGKPLIELTGRDLNDISEPPSSAMAGLTIYSGETTVRGLAIDGFGDRAVTVQGYSTPFSMDQAGIFILGRGGNTIEGCYIGTNFSGTESDANYDGIEILGSSNNQIGGTDALSRNVISGNEFCGVEIFDFGAFGPATTGNIIEGNLIGTNADGTGAVPNGYAFSRPLVNDPWAVGGGVLVRGVEGDVTIGGTEPGAGNLIAFNAGSGVVRIEGHGRVLGNSIYGNFLFGILTHDGGNDLDPDGFYSLGGEAEDGPNYPILSSALTTGGQTVIQGRINDRPNSTFLIQFFSSTSFSAFSFGQGQTYLGSVLVKTDASGNATFTATVAAADSSEPYVTATATNSAGDTSQFSARLAVGEVLGSVYVVNTTDDIDDGVADPSHMTLRDAILAANEHPGLDTIEFDIPGGGVQTIKLHSNLPAIIDPVVIDATTQPGYQGMPLIALDGTHDLPLFSNPPGWTSIGLRLVAGGSTVNGLAISGFQTQVWIEGPAGGNLIEGSFLGPDVTGKLIVDAGVTNGAPGQGILISGSSGNTIGGLTPSARNVISGNDGFGIEDNGGSQEVIEGNFIGTDVTGTRRIGNSQRFIFGIGVYLTGSSFDVIGGTQPSGRNVISGNTGLGLELAGAGNVVQGNYIGTDVTGTQALGNGTGLQVSEFAPGTGGNQIGGATPGAGNLISGNFGPGVQIGPGTGYLVQGNLIGTDVTGIQPLGNRGDGVTVNAGLTNSGDQFPAQDSVGGLAVGAANRIAFNSGRGVNILSGTQISVLGNAIFGNGSLGIDLGGNGVTQNHQGGPASGPNGLQNFPVLTAAVSGPTTRVTGTLNSLPNTTYTVSFYANPAADPSGYGQGQFYLGSVLVHTDASGNASFTLILPAATTAGEVLSATATDPNGDTSEFSQDLALQAPAPTVQVVSVVVNHGAAQRSMVTSLTITFSGIVTLAPGAIAVVSQGGQGVGLVLSTSVVNSQTVVAVAFTGSGVINGSVADGWYNLTIFGNLVHDGTGQALDGASSGTAGSNYVSNNAFFRLFGDANGDGVVDNQDLAIFRVGFRLQTVAYLAIFDFDGNGVIDPNDKKQLTKRYGTRI
jgi:CSLREA domain-containing protein